MTVRSYLQEDGKGVFRAYRVGDLTPSACGPIELLFVLESPHADELECGLPISGPAGKNAVRFLMCPTSTTKALGPFVAALHAKGDGRVAILNVSEVPLQLQAFARHGSRPSLASADWDLLEKVRTRGAHRVDSIRSAAIRAAGGLLLPGLESRVGTLGLSSGATVVTAGKFAQRYRNSLTVISAAAALPVPHPSYDQWNRPSNASNRNLIELRRLFALHTS